VKIEPYRSRSLAPGLVISLLIHAGLLALLVTQRPTPPVAQPVRWLTVSLVPAPVKPAPRIEPVPEPVTTPAIEPVPPRVVPPASPKVRDKAPAMAQAPVRVQPAPRPKQEEDKDRESQHDATAITVMPAAPADAPDPFAVPPPKSPGTFDTTAALKSARKLAVAKAGKDDPAVAQLRDKPINGLAAENELGNNIKQAARPGCLMSAAGSGILAPLLIAAQVLTDKKDHGCKW
jgi:hypothetical protein